MSRITRFECPNCGASLPDPDGDHDIMYCPYCSARLEYDRADKNIRIDKNIRYIDYAKMAKIKQKEESEKRKSKEGWILLIILIAIEVVLIASLTLPGFIRDTKDRLKASSLIEQGYVCPGKSAEDFKGDDVKAVVKQLKSVGFTNIDKVATGGGIAFWSWGDVTEIMIDGDKNFGAHAHFPPDAPIVITFK